MGDFIFGKILMHTTMPVFSPSCINLAAVRTRVIIHDESSAALPLQAITYLLAKMTIDLNFTESLRNSNSSDYINLLTNLKGLVSERIYITNLNF